MESIIKVIDTAALRTLLENPQPPLLLDVRLEEDWTRSRIPGARNNCVFDVVFLDRMTDLATDLNTPIVVYGADAGSFESRMAAEKLRRKGYTEVYEYRDGLLGWTATENPPGEFAIETPATQVADGQYPVDLGESHIRWIGRNLLNRHEGLIRLKSGALRIAGGKLDGGMFTVDMESITCFDLAGDPLHDVLIRHLMDYDFFDAARFPEASFIIRSSADIPGATPGYPNLAISGILTIKDVSGPLEFDACAGLTAEGAMAAQATLAFDRTRWKVLYGSGKWFRHLGGHLVNDLIELQIRIVSAR